MLLTDALQNHIQEASKDLDASLFQNVCHLRDNDYIAFESHVLFIMDEMGLSGISVFMQLEYELEEVAKAA